MNNPTLLFLLFALCSPWAAQAQIFVGQDTLYGNEWIDYNATYYKVNVPEDGVYRVGYAALEAAGVSVSAVNGSNWRLFRNGQQVPLFVSNQGVFTNNDFLEFWGQKNRSEIEQHLFANPDEGLVNPWHSMFSDTSAYYLVQMPNVPALEYAPTPNDLNNLPAVEPYCWRTSLNVFSNSYSKREISEDLIYSWFNGDGFNSAPNTTTTLSVAPAGLYTGGPTEASFRIRYGTNQLQHQLNLSLNGTSVARDTFYNWKLFDRTYNLPLTAFSPALEVKIEGTAAPTDRNFVAGYEVRYPSNFTFSGNLARFQLEASAQDKYLEINGLNTSSGAPLLYDITRRQRIETNLQGSTVQVRLGSSNTLREVVVIAPQAIKSVTSMKVVNFRDYTQAPPSDYIIVSNPKLYKDPQNGNANHVQAYANYRQSLAGGGHQVLVADITEIYEQFGYGLANNPLAIRNFAHFIKKEWPVANFLLFIGKGLEYQSLRANNTLSVLSDSLHYIPMYGYPATDPAFVMPKGSIAKPLMAVGRLAVTRPAQIKDYLDKLQAFEAEQQSGAQTLADRAWMKRVVHASGGTVNDAAIIRAFSDEMANELVSNRFGADIRRFYKNSNDPVQNSAFNQVQDLINDGISMWMVFGHSAPTLVDYDIGTASDYQNNPRYPFMMIMGCFTGTCSLPIKSIGEDFVLTPNRGAIAYTASVYYGFIDALRTYGKGVYQQLGGPMYGKSIGEAMQQNVAALQTNPYTSLIALLHQYTLQGDPAVKIQVAPGPDYVVDPQSVSISPNPVPTDRTTYEVAFDVVNIGENVAGNFALKMEDKQPDGTLHVAVTDTIAAPALRQRVTLTVPNDSASAGFHRLLLQVDANNAIEELPGAAEQNNRLVGTNGGEGVEVYFYSNDVQPIYPPDFAIEDSTRLVLHASAFGDGAVPTRYLFELDTIEKFNSPFKKQHQVLQSTGILRWPVDLGLPDSTVVYWRVARDSLVNGQIPWKTNSFVYLKGSLPGWNQSDFGQWKTNRQENVSANEITRTLGFAENTASILMRVCYRDGGTFPGFINSFNEGILSNFQLGQAGFYDGVGVMVLNPKTGRVVWNPPGGPHNPAPSDKRKFFFHFDTGDSLRRIALMEFMKNDIPDGAVVGVLVANQSWNTAGYSPKKWANDSISYGQNLFQVFEQYGARHVRELDDYPSVPPAYGFIFRKNDADFEPTDTIMDTPGTAQYTEIRGTFPAPWFEGQFTSGNIGPAKAWRSLHFRPRPGDHPTDEGHLALYGIRANGQDTLLLTVSSAKDTLLTAWSAAEYPNMRLVYSALDTVLHTIQPIDYLRVLYDPIPEGALDPLAKFDFASDTLEEGQSVEARIAFANVSQTAFDSLVVKYRIENQAGNNINVVQKLRPLLVNDTLHAAVRVSTKGLRGTQRLLIDVNPDNAQPEWYHFNNVAFRPFFVTADGRNPVLDVTFDGNHLLDGDLISPKPEVFVRLNDDNRYLALSDTNLFEIKVTYPDGNTLTLPFNDPNLVFIPAVEGNLDKKNEARIEWRPYFDQDGEYQMSVQGRDATGNASASATYSVRFKVINKSSISNLLNYPNPFSTSTCFYYTMTGAETPTNFRLQIMTVSGKVVREVTEAEFGPLQAGTRQSQFCWDGKDAFGDQLANGVYLYRISARKQDGTPFEFFENTSIDGFFKNGIGKMVLMR